MEGIADYIEDPAREITADVPVVAKAMELGALRHAQGFDSYEILKEYEILGGILFAFLVEEVQDTNEPCSPGELLACAQRLFRAVATIQQTTLTHFLNLANERVHEREQRLRAFNRAISHELKNNIGAVLGAGELLLTVETLAPRDRENFARIIVRNARDMQATMENLLDVSRLDTDARQQRHVQLPEAVAEVVRRLRESAEARGVAVRVGSLPKQEVNAAAVELVLTNYVSNAIKYSDPSVPDRWVHIAAEMQPLDETGGCKLVVTVSDNGRGVPEESRSKLFDRFFRAHETTATGIEGTGLGLSIVRQTVESAGGSTWAEFPERGAIFGFWVPCRKDSDERRESASAADAAAR
jgi:signal transduction histidine kinase